MNGDTVRSVKAALEKAAGRDLSLVEFGGVVGLKSDRANRTMRNWIDKGPSGPGAMAIGYLSQGLGNGPTHICGRCETGDLYVVRLKWPRFILRIGVNSAELIRWIDDVEALTHDRDWRSYRDEAIKFARESV